MDSNGASINAFHDADERMVVDHHYHHHYHHMMKPEAKPM
jgi:hypothetical protein